jgi:hypothetical protein
MELATDRFWSLLCNHFDQHVGHEMAGCCLELCFQTGTGNPFSNEQASLILLHNQTLI